MNEKRDNTGPESTRALWVRSELAMSQADALIEEADRLLLQAAVEQNEGAGERMDENPYRAPQAKPEALPVDRVRTFSIALGLLGGILLALIPRYGGWAALTVLVALVLAGWIRRRHRTS